MSKPAIHRHVLPALLGAALAAGSAAAPAPVIELRLGDTSYGGARMVAPAAFDPLHLPARGEIVFEARKGTPLEVALAGAAQGGRRLERLPIHPSGAAATSLGELRDCTIVKREEKGAIVHYAVRYAAFAAPTEPVPGGRPDPGGPDQGYAAAQVLPNLTIRSATAQPGGATKVQALVVNAGAGPSAATALKLFYHHGAKVLTASAPIPALASGQQAFVGIGVDEPLSDADSVTLRADDPNTVAETNELDNGFILP